MNKKRKRVCFVCYGLGIGGIEKCLVNLIKGYTRILIVCNHIYPYCFDTDTLLGISAVSYLNVAELCVSHAVTIEHRSLCICCPCKYTHSRHRYGRCIQLFRVAS